MVDYRGMPIYVGDEVTFIRSGYRELQDGVVTKVGKKRITIKADGSGTLKIRDPGDCIREVIE